MDSLDFDLRKYTEIITLIDKFLIKYDSIFKSFFDESTSSFFRKKKEDDHISLTSTSTCILSLFNSKKLEMFKSLKQEITLNSIFKEKEWKPSKIKGGKIYTIGLLLPCIRILLGSKVKNWKVNLKDDQIKRIEDSLEYIKILLLNNSEKNNEKNIWEHGRVYIEKYAPNSFLTYWSLTALKSFNQFEAKIFKFTYNSTLLSLYKEISHFDSNDLENFDIYQLLYSLLILIKFFMHNFPKTIIAHVLEIIFQSQTDIGRWEKGQPLFNYPEAGNAYCHDFEMLRSLLIDLGHSYFDLIIKYLPNLKKALEWIDTHYQESKTFDIRGWCSGHDATWPFPESWATAAILDFLIEYKKIFQKTAQNQILRDFGYYEDNTSKAPKMTDILDSVLKIKEKRKFLIKDILGKKFKKGLDAKDLACGIIFGGPPATGKTTLAKSIAKEIDWKFIEIWPGKFIENNPWAIGKTAKEIFEKLLVLENVVVLFDELDELVRHRGEESEIISRFMTTTILPYFQKLSQQKKIIFIVTTNHIKKFDPAIQRIGRFDLVLNINQPSRNNIFKRFEEVLEENEVSSDKIENLFNFINWEWYKEQLLDLNLPNSIEFVNKDLQFDEKFKEETLFDAFIEKVKPFCGEKISILKGHISESQESDGFIDIYTDEELKSYKNNENFYSLNNVFNRFTYIEIKPLVESELIKFLSKGEIDYDGIKKEFISYGNVLVLSKAYSGKKLDFKTDCRCDFV